MFMLSSSNFQQVIYVNYEDYPDCQKLDCKNNDLYIFVRERTGYKTKPSSGVFGKYLYRNCRNNLLMSSHEKPINNKQYYSGGDIGTCADAIPYYKNS
jgi:hypothetical protein